jgi:hypothetical protein
MDDIAIAVHQAGLADIRAETIEECAKICDELGDAEFAKIMKRGNTGIATLAQRHYMACAAAIRRLIGN